MRQLKNETINKCFSLLREYIDETTPSGKKETAVLALNQLRSITAGAEFQVEPLTCHGRPMAEASLD